MSNYLLELGAIHLILILGYWVLLRREHQYAKMRLYLIGASLLSLLIPLLKLPKLTFGQEEPIISVIPLEQTVVQVVPISPVEETVFWNLELLIVIYLSVSSLLLLRFIFQMYQIIALERGSKYEKFNDLYVRKVRHIQGSFTFFNWIFLNDDINRDHEDYHVILKHEKAHSSLGHSYDLIFIELFKVCFWWVPSIWFTNKEIRKIHEYQADAHALKSYHIDRYSSILISSTLATHGLSLASSFHDGFIFKRLNAMKQKAKSVSPWKLGTLMAVGVLLVVAFACSEEVDANIKKMGEHSNAITFEQLPKDLQTKLADIQDQLSFIRIDLEEGQEFEDVVEELDTPLIHSLQFDKSKSYVIVALKKDEAFFHHVSETSKSEENVFTIVEDQPEYTGGMPEFYKYVASQIAYPLEARRNEVEGTVYVQFVVEKDGKVTDAQAVKGIGYGCDEEAVRAVQSVGAFSPGRQRGKAVRVRMMMPIQFKLNNNFVSENGTQGGTIILEEVQSDQEKFAVEAKYEEGEWSGTIYNAEGNILPGVNIVVTGTTRGTVSDLDGNFRVQADPESELQVSFVGYETVKLVAE